jgi:pyruvate, water dikinase
MTLLQVGGFSLVLILCPLLGALPLAEWTVYAIAGKQATRSSISSDKGWLSSLINLSIEALTGIGAVFLARIFFSSGSPWELIALVGLVMGRYWSGRGGGIFAVLTGVACHDPISLGLISLIGGIGLVLVRASETKDKFIFLIVGLILSLRHSSDTEYIFAAIFLMVVLWWSSLRIPHNDALVKLLLSRSHLYSLDRAARSSWQDRGKDRAKFGRKAANLARLHRWGYPVPHGWLVFAGDDVENIARSLNPSAENPLFVRSSLIEEASVETVSKVGKSFYRRSIVNRQQLEAALVDCRSMSGCRYHSTTNTSRILGNCV